MRYIFSKKQRKTGENLKKSDQPQRRSADSAGLSLKLDF